MGQAMPSSPSGSVVRTGRAMRHRNPLRRGRVEQWQSSLPAAELKALRAAGKELRLSFIPARLPSGKGAFPDSVERLLNEML